MTSLAAASSYFHIKLVWVPGHSGIVGNCKADVLAWKGTVTQIPSGWEWAGVLLSLCLRLLDLWALRELRNRWSATGTCGVGKGFWPRVERKRSIEPLALSKVLIAVIIGILTGYCPIGSHAVRLKILVNSTCQSSRKEQEMESTWPFLLDCPAFVRLRLKHLGCNTLYEPCELAGTDVNRFTKFLVAPRRFIDMRRTF